MSDTFSFEDAQDSGAAAPESYPRQVPPEVQVARDQQSLALLSDERNNSDDKRTTDALDKEISNRKGTITKNGGVVPPEPQDEGVSTPGTFSFEDASAPAASNTFSFEDAQQPVPAATDDSDQVSRGVANGSVKAPVAKTTFTGAMKALGQGIMAGGAAAGSAIDMAGAVFPIIADHVMGGTSREDQYFKEHDAVFGNAKEFWSQPQNQPLLHKVMYGIGNMGIPLALGGGNPSLMIASQQLNSGEDLVKAGIDPTVANATAGIEATLTGLGMKVPFLGKTLLTKVGSGALTMPVVGGLSTEVSKAILKANGYDAQAKAYDPLDPDARIVDAVTGAIFGVAAHGGEMLARKVAPTTGIVDEPTAPPAQAPAATGTAPAGLNPLVPPTDLAVIRRAGEELRARMADPNAPISPETEHVAQHVDDVLADPAKRAAFEGDREAVGQQADQTTPEKEEGTGTPVAPESSVEPPAESAPQGAETTGELSPGVQTPESAPAAPESSQSPIRAEDIGVPSAVDKAYFTATKADGELSIPQTEDEQAIQTGLNARLARAGQPELSPGAIRIEEPTDAEAAFSAQFKKAFGTEVTWVTSSEKSGVDGFVSNRDGGNRTIYIVRPEGDFNRSTAMFIAGHELTHVMRQLHPDIYAELHAAMKDFVSPEGKQAAAAVHGVADEDRGNGLGSKLDEEINADFGGRLLSDPKFVDHLRDSNPTLFGQVAVIVREFLHKMVEMAQAVSVRNAKFVRDTTAARDAWAKALTEFAKREQLPSTETGERRSDVARRKAVEEMSPEEMKAALKTDEMTGLGNRRAYEEAPKRAVTVSVDADSLKWVNDNMGHESGDHLLRMIGEALNGHDAYHISGDEFLAQFDTHGQAAVAMKTVEQALKKAVLTVKTPDGKTITIKGVGATHGIGADKASADVELNKRKAERQQAGERAARGEPPPGLVRKPGRAPARQAPKAPEGKQDRQQQPVANAKPAAVKGEAAKPEAVRPKDADYQKAFDRVGELQMDPELKKSQVKTLANQALAKGLLHPDDHAEVVRILKEMDAEDALDDLHTSLINNAKKADISAAPDRTSDVGHKRRKSGDYVGAPPSVRNPAGLAALRAKFEKLAREGEAGRMWYEKSGEALLKYTGGNKEDAERLATVIAIYSPNATVPANTQMALNAYHQWKAGEPIKAGFGSRNAAAKAYLEDGVIPDSPKIHNFRQNMLRVINPEKLGEKAQGVTVDMQMARAAGFKLDKVSDAQYEFVAREVKRIAAKLGWENQQAQAAIWVAIKARVEQVRDEVKAYAKKMGMLEQVENDGALTWQPKKEFEGTYRELLFKKALKAELLPESVEKAKADFSDTIGKKIAQLSWEAAPSKDVAYMSAVLRAPIEQQAEFLAATHKALTDENGRDLIAEKIGLLAAEARFNPSAWEGTVGVGGQTLATVPTAKGDAKKVSPEARKLLDLWSAATGLVLKQDAVYWHYPIFTIAKARQNGVQWTFKNDLSVDDARTLYRAISDAAGHDEWAPAVNGNVVRVLNFTDAPNADFHAIMQRAIDGLPEGFAGTDVVEGKGFGTDGSAISNDWTKDTQGEEYRNQISGAGRSDLLGWLTDTLAPAVERAQREVADKHGWDISASPDREQADEGSVQDGRGIRGSVRVLDEPSGSHPLADRPAGQSPLGDRPLEGLPATVKVDGQEVTFGPHLPARAAAADYMREAGQPYNPPRVYAKVDKARATRIADAFEAMEHEPDHPAVKASYDAMIRETLAQWQAIKKTGLKVEFIRGDDPYGNPRNAILDVVRNNHLWVYPTDAGFGGSESAHVDISGNPLLAVTDEIIDGHKLRANDVFRIVHDYFGHIKEGVGFRAEGEENAWQQHQAMYSDLARPAMTTETRGQNSWVNFGPYAESNKTASGADTQYAPQKIGLLPRFANDEGVSASPSRTDSPEFRRWFGDSKIVNEDGTPQVWYHGSARDIKKFKPKQSDAVFLTDNPDFADSFSDSSKDWMKRHGMGSRAHEATYPLFVRAENPFDYESGAQQVALRAKFMEMNPGKFSGDRAQRNMQYWQEVGAGIKVGEWDDIERPDVQAAIKALGHDSFYVVEGGQRNLAVYDPNQVKAAYGNNGDYSRENNDISAAPARSFGDALLKSFAPASRGDLAQQTAGIMRDNLARQARDREVAFHDLEAHMKMFDKLSPKESYDFIDAMEHGLGRGRLSVIGHPEWDAPATALAKLLDQRRGTVASLGTGKLQQFIENYFPHIWADPVKAQSFFQSRRPIEGSKAFLKQRTYEDFTDGLAAGLKPLTDNPVRLALLKAREMDRYIYGQRIFQEMKANGLAQFVRFGQKAPDGWTKLDDKIAKVMFPAKDGQGMIQAGDYWAPDGAATIFNNHLSPGLVGNPVYDAVRKSGNMLNAAQLGFSLFHLGFTTADAMISKTALGFYKLGHGSILSGASDVAQGAANLAQPFVNLYKGDRLLRAYLGKLQDPGLVPVVEALVQSGGRVSMDDFYRNAGVSEFRDALRTGRYGSAAMQFLPTVMDRVMAPVMQWLVPRQKLGVFFDLAHYALKENPDMTLDEKRAMLGKMWDSVDNRLGQMVYDNLFWKRTLKDAAMVTVRSVGWNLGTIRELGGGILDVKDIPKGGFSTRTAYIAALTFNAALWGSIMQYLMTGQGPQETKDMFFPKTGRIRPDGTEDRVSLPTYMKDVYEYSHDISGFVKYGANPAQTLLNKMHPLISMVAQMLQNEDFFGAAIRNPGDDFGQQMKDELSYLVKQMQPFGIRNFQQQKATSGDTDSSPLEDVAKYATSPTMYGITPSPGYITKTDEQTESATVTRMRDSLVSKYRQQIKDGEDPVEVESRAQRAGLSPRDVRFILNAATPRPPKLHHFGIR